MSQTVGRVGIHTAQQIALAAVLVVMVIEGVHHALGLVQEREKGGVAALPSQRTDLPHLPCPLLEDSQQIADFGPEIELPSGQLSASRRSRRRHRGYRVMDARSGWPSGKPSLTRSLIAIFGGDTRINLATDQPVWGSGLSTSKPSSHRIPRALLR